MPGTATGNLGATGKSATWKVKTIPRIGLDAEETPLSSRPGTGVAGSARTSVMSNNPGSAVVRRMLGNLGSHKRVMLQKFDLIDQTRTGSVAMNRFFDTLEHFDIPVSRQDQHLVMEAYGDKSGCRVKYREVLAEC